MLTEFLTDYTFQTVTIGASLLGLVSGVLSVFTVLRRQSLIGDVISHAALPGIVLTYLLFKTKVSSYLLLGGGLSGWLGMICVLTIVRRSRLKLDNAFGLILSVFFGIGVLLLNYTQKIPDASQAGLSNFLFGQASTILPEDIYLTGILGIIILLFVCIFWKEFKLLSFDAGLCAGLGFPVRLLDFFLMTLIVSAIMIGLQIVGVILMASMIIAPAAAARQWTNKLSPLTIIAGLIGGISGSLGALISSIFNKVPTGPVIIIILSFTVVISMLIAPGRGLIWRWFTFLNARHYLRMDLVLSNIYALSKQHMDEKHAHSFAVLARMSIKQNLPSCLRAMKSLGWIQEEPKNMWRLTPLGKEKAELNQKKTPTP